MNINTAYFAGGCFWCMTKPFDTFDGIEKVTSGYMGGHIEKSYLRTSKIRYEWSFRNC